MTRDQAREEGYLFPWTRESGSCGLVPSKLRWSSLDPNDKTWTQLFHRLENERATSVADLCEEYGVNVRYAARVWMRFDRWRRGETIRPTVDPVAAIRRLREQCHQNQASQL